MSSAIFKQRFTPLQVNKLNSVGFYDLYSFITYLPFDIVKITPLVNIYTTPIQGQTYLTSGRLKLITHRTGKQRFLVLDFEGDFDLRCYLFSVASFTLKALQIGQNYQLLLTYNTSGFWSIEKFAPLKDTLSNQKNFILGQAESRDYLLPKYIKSGEMRNGDFHNLHRKLIPTDYLLNLDGLIPENSILPQILDLSGIHKPTSSENYRQTSQHWTALKVYLRLVLLRYIDEMNQETFALSGKLDLDFLKRLIAKLPFELSNSQKTVIWEILQEVTETS
jgi:RecG-like helicase